MPTLTEIRLAIERRRALKAECIDLATGALLLPPSHDTVSAMQSVRLCSYSYTASIGLRSTRERLADLLSGLLAANIRVENVALVSGGTEGVFLCLAVAGPKRWLHIWPGWHTIKQMSTILNMTTELCSLADVKSIVQREEGAGLFINTPVNPTGEYVHLDLIKDGIQHNVGSIIVDLTYMGITAGDYTEYFRRLIHYGLDYLDHCILVFSLSKLFRLPGLRLGFIIASDNMINRVAHAKSATTLNMPVELQELLASLWGNVHDEMAEVGQFVQTRKEWFLRECAARRLNSVAKDGTHYGMISLPHADVDICTLAERGIFVAPCGDMGVPNAIRVNLSVQESGLIRMMDSLAACHQR